MILLVILLTGTWGLSLFGTFDSPNIFRTNVALTYNEVEGMEWFYQARESENVIVPLSQIGRFHDLFDDGYSDKRIGIPDHFGYDTQNKNFAQINLELREQVYIVIQTIDELLYQKVPGYIEVHRYNESDFKRFRNDPSVNKIYNSLNIEIFKSNRQ